MDFFFLNFLGFEKLLLKQCGPCRLLGYKFNLLELLGFAEFLTSNKGKEPPSLLSLCLGVVGSNLEDIIDDLAEIAPTFPSDIKVEVGSSILLGYMVLNELQFHFC